MYAISLIVKLSVLAFYKERIIFVLRSGPVRVENLRFHDSDFLYRKWEE